MLLLLMVRSIEMGRRSPKSNRRPAASSRMRAEQNGQQSASMLAPITSWSSPGQM